jgi:hypothetical protein
VGTLDVPQLTGDCEPDHEEDGGDDSGERQQVDAGWCVGALSALRASPCSRPAETATSEINHLILLASGVPRRVGLGPSAGPRGRVLRARGVWPAGRHRHRCATRPRRG